MPIMRFFRRKTKSSPPGRTPRTTPSFRRKATIGAALIATVLGINGGKPAPPKLSVNGKTPASQPATQSRENASRPASRPAFKPAPRPARIPERSTLNVLESIRARMDTPFPVAVGAANSPIFLNREFQIYTLSKLRGKITEKDLETPKGKAWAFQLLTDDAYAQVTKNSMKYYINGKTFSGEEGFARLGPVQKVGVLAYVAITGEPLIASNGFVGVNPMMDPQIEDRKLGDAAMIETSRRIPGSVRDMLPGSVNAIIRKTIPLSAKGLHEWKKELDKGN